MEISATSDTSRNWVATCGGVARVERVKSGEDGVVRTITVCFRPRHVSDKGQTYKSKPEEEMEIGVQRFAVLLPVEEQGRLSEPVADDEPLPQASEMT